MMTAERPDGDDRVTLASDKAFDKREFVKEMPQMKVTPYVAQNDGRQGA